MGKGAKQVNLVRKPYYNQMPVSQEILKESIQATLLLAWP